MGIRVTKVKETFSVHLEEEPISETKKERKRLREGNGLNREKGST
jgi:hypothetical protein